MPIETRILAVASSVGMLLLVIELVRRRRLKEEYSVLWVLTALVLLVLSLWYPLLLKITEVVGAVMPSSTLFFFGLVFALLMLLHFSVRVSSMERRVTTLVQELGLLTVMGERERPAGEELDLDTPRVRGERFEHER
jgi:hypothetical protein